MERLTLVDAYTLHYEVTIFDPTVFTRPWTMAYPIRRVRDKGFEIMEFARGTVPWICSFSVRTRRIKIASPV